MKEKSIKFNAILYMLTTGLGVLYPLITFPYISHILSVENLGRVNYGTSVIGYFSLVATLGINTYAVREGAKYRDNYNLFSEFANEIFTTNIFTTVISYVLFFLCMFIFPQFSHYRLLLCLQSVSIGLSTIGVNWINSIYEDYFFITIRTICVQIVSIFLMFLLVRSSQDVYQYAFLLVFSNGITSFFNIIYVKKYVHLHIVKCNIFMHLRSAIVFFASNLAITIYVSSDTIMLNWLKGDFFTGLYSVPVKIYSILKSLLTCIYTVAIPRLTSFYNNNQIDKYKELLTDLISNVVIFATPIMVGIICKARNIIYIVSGSKYEKSIVTLRLLSVALIFSVFSGLIVNGMNVTIGKEKNSLEATTLSALINIVLNIWLIRLFAQDGAAVTTIVSELFVVIFCVLKCGNNIFDYFNFKRIIIQFVQSSVASLGIIIVCVISGIMLQNCVVDLLLSIFISIICYFGLLIIMKNYYVRSLLDDINKNWKSFIKN